MKKKKCRSTTTNKQVFSLKWTMKVGQRNYSKTQTSLRMRALGALNDERWDEDGDLQTEWYEEASAISSNL